jgi:hypothetical protein
MFNKNNLNSRAAVIKKAYLKGEYPVNGKILPMPFGAAHKKFFAMLPENCTAPVVKDFSDNFGGYAHNLNVVFCMNDLMDYVRENGGALLPDGEKDVDVNLSEEQQFIDIWKSWCHDVGKIIVPRRHAVEGKSMFLDMKASVKYQFEAIFAEHGFDISPKTFALFAEHIGTHDLLGTISTGENNVLSLYHAVERFRSIHNGDKKAVKNEIFSLFLLNVADIKTSLIRKFELQDWTSQPAGTLDSEFDEFFASYKGKFLVEDLKFALEIAESDEPYEYAKKLSAERAAHRLQRLARQTLGDKIEKDAAFPEGLKNEIVKLLDNAELIIPQIKDILCAEMGEGYAQMFGTMLQFDYALGFFLKLSDRAIYWLKNELSGGSFRTGWRFNQKMPGDTKPAYPQSFLDKHDAECIIKNYITVLAGIFGAISRLTADIHNFNIEFCDASDRLSNSKADKHLFFDGPNRRSSALSQLMRELFLYKS